MDLTQNMRVAREVARLGGFAAAARSLNLSPPSVSRLVGELEADLGVRLFSRTTRSLSLTDEGQVFVRRAGEILEDIEALRAELVVKETEPRGTLRVSSVVAFGTELMPVAIARFLERYPAIDVDLSITNRQVDLVEEHIDVAIRIGSAEGLEDSGLIARRIFSQTRIFVATPGFVTVNGAPSTPEDAGAVPMVRFVTGRFGRSHGLIGPDGRQAEFGTPGKLLVDTPIAARNAVRSGRYMGLVADYLVADDLRSGRLVRLMEPWSTRPQPIFAVCAHRTLMPARLRVFLDFMAELFADPGVLAKLHD